MAQCLFQLLKQVHHAVKIDVLAPAWSFPLLERMPEVHHAMIMPIGHGEFHWRQRYQMGQRLRAKQYDQAIVLPNSFKSALIPFFANIPLRTGFRGEWRYGLLNDIRQLDKQRYPLMIERFMALGLPEGKQLPDHYPIPMLHVTEASQQAVLDKYQLTLTKPLLALCPGAEFGPAKRWPEAYYAEVAKQKLAAGWDVWLLGSVKDQASAECIMEITEQRCVNLTGKTALAEAVDLLSLATCIVSNDSGLMHIGSALQKPLVAIYGPTSASFTPPLSTKAQVLSLALDCQPCCQRVCPLKHHHCMSQLKPSIVIHAIDTCVH